MITVSWGCFLCNLILDLKRNAVNFCLFGKKVVTLHPNFIIRIILLCLERKEDGTPSQGNR